MPTVPDAAQTAWAAFIRLFDELRKICREFIGILPMLYDYHMDFPEPQFSALSPLHSQAHKFETSSQVISATHPQLFSFLKLCFFFLTCQQGAATLQGGPVVGESGNQDDLIPRALKSGKGSSSSKDPKSSQRSTTLKITVRNLAYLQPMSGFFVMAHNAHATPLFQLGEPATDALATLAEEGDASALVNMFSEMETTGVDQSSIGVFSNGGPLTPFESLTFEVKVSKKYPYVSFASMAINTNDCFIGINARELVPGMSFTVPGYDYGTEENNEDCGFIPGPFCQDINTDSAAAGNGEGVVHVHRGVHGVADLIPAELDWRNPMLLVTVE